MMRFAFSWDPDRDPAIRPTGKCADVLEGWASAVPEGVDQPSPNAADMVDLSDFCDDMAIYLFGLLAGIADGFTQDLLDQQRAWEAANAGVAKGPLLDLLQARLGIRVDTKLDVPANHTGTTPG